MPTWIEVAGGDGGSDGARTEGRAGCEPSSGTVTIATYTVRDGRGEGEGGEEYIGIVSAARALDMVGVDEPILPHPPHPPTPTPYFLTWYLPSSLQPRRVPHMKCWSAPLKRAPSSEQDPLKSLVCMYVQPIQSSPKILNIIGCSPRYLFSGTVMQSISSKYPQKPRDKIGGNVS